MVELIGCYPLGVGREHEQGDALCLYKLNGMGNQQFAKTFSAKGFIDYYILNPGFATRRAMIDAYGKHAGYSLVLKEEKEMTMAGC